MTLSVDRFDLEQLPVQESLFHVANGYIGIRGNFEEGAPQGVRSVRGAYINGYYDEITLSYPERLYGFPERAQRMVNLPDPQTTLICIEGVPFDLTTGELLSYRRTLDTDRGITVRQAIWHAPNNVCAELCFTRMASFVHPELFLTRIEIKTPPSAGIGVSGGVCCDVTNFTDPDDPRVASEVLRHIQFDGAEIHGALAVARCRTAESNIGVAVAQSYQSNVPFEVRVTSDGFIFETQTVMPSDGYLCIDKYTIFSDERRQSDSGTHALDVGRACIRLGSERLFDEQAEYMRQFWAASRVSIDGDDETARGLEFSLYGLLQSAGRDSIGNVAAKGLSGEGYEGHYFWDTEIYILPFFLLTQPDIARELLDFRYSVLGAAREHARLMGHERGALYPWRTISGSECSSYFPAGSAQYHIAGDVAHAFMQYYYVTDDLDYMARKGAEVVLETARLWLDVGHYDRAGRFCIDTVTGPDEYSCLVNNNYYTNQNARHNLLAAIEIYEDLRRAGQEAGVRDAIGFAEETELADFRAAADAMVLPYDEELGICAQDDRFLDKAVWDFAGTPREKYPLLLHYAPLALYRRQVCKQADTVLAHYLFGGEVGFEVRKRTYEYYEGVTTHDSSLSACVFSIMAARLGMPEKAYQYYLRTVRTDLDNEHGNTRDGIHTANMGGAYLGLVAGFAGLDIRREGLRFRFRLPPEWTGYRFRVRFRGRMLEVRVTEGQAEILLLEGVPVRVFIEDAPYEIADRMVWQGNTT